MINTLSTWEAADILSKHGFSRLGSFRLVEWYEGLEDDQGTPIEMDAVAISCDWSEYTVKELEDDYDYIMEELDLDLQELTPEERTSALVEEVEQRTCIMEVDQLDGTYTYLVQAF
jgi:hypothetical protein